VRRKRPIIYNDFKKSPNRKGLPKGHFPLTRFASVPIIEGKKVRCVFGVGNKKKPYRDEDVIRLQIVANVMQEIIVQRRSKKSAEESDARHCSLFSAMNDLVVQHEIVYDPTGRAVDYRILDCNPAFTFSTGIPHEKAVGALASKLYGMKPPPYFDEYLKVAEGGQQKRLEVFFEPLRKHYAITAISTGPGKFATLTTDITERVAAMDRLARSEEKFSKAFHANPVGLLLVRVKDAKILEFNDAILEITGYDRDEITGRTTLELGLWKDAQDRQQVVDILMSGERVPERELEFRNKKGEMSVCRYSAETLEVEGERCGLATLMDITQRRKDENTIQELLGRVEHDNEELRKLDRLKNDFISIVAHDLRTPLTSINGYLRLLADPRLGQLDAQQSDFVDLALKNTRRLNNLIANFLDLSVMESGELKIKTREVRLNEIVLEAIKALKNLAEAKLIRLTMDLPESGLVLMADPDKLEQVFINLLGNAVKFTPQKGSITVGARLDSRGGHKGVLAWVKDNGPGIPEDELAKVFDKFYQIDNKVSRMVPGTGLGLTICRRIVEAHNGQIWVESVEGQGASFNFFIPNL
jgi:PAS domain S-box-containing protein